jgi:hypothetical protein
MLQNEQGDSMDRTLRIAGDFNPNSISLIDIDTQVTAFLLLSSVCAAETSVLAACDVIRGVTARDLYVKQAPNKGALYIVVNRPQLTIEDVLVAIDTFREISKRSVSFVMYPGLIQQVANHIDQGRTSNETVQLLDRALCQVRNLTQER